MNRDATVLGCKDVFNHLFFQRHIVSNRVKIYSVLVDIFFIGVHNAKIALRFYIKFYIFWDFLLVASLSIYFDLER